MRNEIALEKVLETNTTKSVGQTSVERRSEYLSCPKCGLEFNFDFWASFELHLMACKQLSEKIDEAAASSRVMTFKEEISDEPF